MALKMTAMAAVALFFSVALHTKKKRYNFAPLKVQVCSINGAKLLL